VIIGTLSNDEKYMFMANQFAGMTIYNVSNPVNITLVSSLVFPLNNNICFILPTDNNLLAFASAYGGIFTVLLADLLNPQVIGFTMILPMSQNFELHFMHGEDYLVIANQNPGTVVMDVRNVLLRTPPIELPILATAVTSYWTNLRQRISPDNNYIFSHDLWFGLFIVDARPIYQILSTTTLPINLPIVSAF
jgi:hypothetical protein